MLHFLILSIYSSLTAFLSFLLHGGGHDFIQVITVSLLLRFISQEHPLHGSFSKPSQQSIVQICTAVEQGIQGPGAHEDRECTLRSGPAFPIVRIVNQTLGKASAVIFFSNTRSRLALREPFSLVASARLTALWPKQLQALISNRE